MISQGEGALSRHRGWTAILAVLALTGCAQGVIPQARNVNIPPPRQAEERPEAVNDRPDSVMYLPLGHDVLVPEIAQGEPLPDRQVGPFELRGETLGGALQLILSDMDIPLAFETEEGLTRTITVANLKGKLSDVVAQVCSLADLYCAYEHNALVIKARQTFTVTLPPVGTAAEQQAMLTNVSAAIGAITGSTPVSDTASRTLIYDATSRTAEKADRYFQRLRASTALIVFETYVWEVSLDSAHSAGIKWGDITGVKGNSDLKFGFSMSGTTNPELGTPISIGLPTRGEVNLSTGDVLKFISNYGAVKTISQPQLTMLSGSQASLRVVDTQNYVSQFTRTIVDNQTTVSTEADSVDSGFTMTINSSWDNATVYGNINLLLEEVRAIDTFDDNPDAVVQLPQTTQREVKTQVRVRPGDSLLIAGLVREVDTFDKSGIGLETPILPTSRSGGTRNVELVFLIKPRVIAFTEDGDANVRKPVTADVPAPPVPARPAHDGPGKKAITQSEPVDDTKSNDQGAPIQDKRSPPKPAGKPTKEKTSASNAGAGLDNLLTPLPGNGPSSQTMNDTMPTAPQPGAVTVDRLLEPADASDPISLVPDYPPGDEPTPATEQVTP